MVPIVFTLCLFAQRSFGVAKRSDHLARRVRAIAHLPGPHVLAHEPRLTYRLELPGALEQTFNPRYGAGEDDFAATQRLIDRKDPGYRARGVLPPIVGGSGNSPIRIAISAASPRRFAPSRENTIDR